VMAVDPRFAPPPTCPLLRRRLAACWDAGRRRRRRGDLGAISSIPQFGRLCSKGRRSAKPSAFGDRLLYPMIPLQQGHLWSGWAWTMALDMAQIAFAPYAKRDGPDAVGILSLGAIA